jgi:hypothetical protein
MIAKGFISDVRRQVIRKRIWYVALNGTERRNLSITAKIIDSVNSNVLNSQLMRIIAKRRDVNVKATSLGILKVMILKGSGLFRNMRYSLDTGVPSLFLDTSIILDIFMFIDFIKLIYWRTLPS